MRILCVVPARGGSKGVPRKNLRLVGGKPLLVWTLEQALSTRPAMDVVVSTDDEEIAAVARTAGALVVGLLLLVWAGTPSVEKRRRRRRRLGARDLEGLGASLSAAWRTAAIVGGAIVFEQLGAHLVGGPVLWTTLAASWLDGAARGERLVGGVEPSGTPGDPILVEHAPEIEGDEAPGAAHTDPSHDDPADPTDQVSGGIAPLEDPSTGEPPIAPPP